MGEREGGREGGWERGRVGEREGGREGGRERGRGRGGKQKNEENRSVYLTSGAAESFSLDCHKTKTKVIETANQKKENITKSQSECKVKSSTMLTDIAFGFESNWLRGWYKFSGTSTQ